MRSFLCLACLMLTLTCADRAECQEPDPVPFTLERWQIGLSLQAPGACTGIVASLPVPKDWPEQRVREVDRRLSPASARLQYKRLDDGVLQIVITIPRLNAGESAEALVTLEVAKRTIPAPQDPSAWQAPQRIPTELRSFLGSSPSIETTHPKIRRLAGTIIEGKTSDWDKVEAIYDWVRKTVRYEFDEQLRGALTALEAGHGDCEELTSLFVALCRANQIPARSVWIPGHCYPEFYLQDAAGDGRWFPCQAAGSRQFGEMTESRPILQKGDRFRVPGERTPKRYVAETFRAQDVQAPPQVQWIRRKL